MQLCEKDNMAYKHAQKTIEYEQTGHVSLRISLNYIMNQEQLNYKGLYKTNCFQRRLDIL